MGFGYFGTLRQIKRNTLPQPQKTAHKDKVPRVPSCLGNVHQQVIQTMELWRDLVVQSRVLQVLQAQLLIQLQERTAHLDGVRLCSLRKKSSIDIYVVLHLCKCVRAVSPIARAWNFKPIAQELVNPINKVLHRKCFVARRQFWQNVPVLSVEAEQTEAMPAGWDLVCSAKSLIVGPRSRLQLRLQLGQRESLAKLAFKLGSHQGGHDTARHPLVENVKEILSQEQNVSAPSTLNPRIEREAENKHSDNNKRQTRQA